jgi:hypothetical protein
MIMENEHVKEHKKNREELGESEWAFLLMKHKNYISLRLSTRERVAVTKTLNVLYLKREVMEPLKCPS